MDDNGDFYNDFPNFKVLTRRFQTDCDEINSQKKIKLYQNGELITMAQYPNCCMKRK